MKLSDLIKEREEHSLKEGAEPLSSSVFGVEIDQDSVAFDPPVGVTEIGLRARFTSNEFPDDVLDHAVIYQTARLAVLVEIEHESTFDDFNHVISTIEAIGASVAFLPPKELTEDSFELYCSRMEEVAKVYCSKVNFEQWIMPVSSYFTHMIVELLDPRIASDFVPEDGYVIENFHKAMPVEYSDRLKARLKTAIHGCFADDDGTTYFAEAMLGLCASMVGDVDASLRQHAELVASQTPPAPEPVAKKPAPVKKPTAGKKASKTRAATGTKAKPVGRKKTSKTPSASAAKATTGVKHAAKAKPASAAGPKPRKPRADKAQGPA
jgi:hypothetical protein